jgi:hypothetical protein
MARAAEAGSGPPHSSVYDSDSVFIWAISEFA